ncbi:DUF1254 domain-containing protein [Bradyrhizobium erythrophlei]|uniref:DUF1254 domain-containing protein n=1 Tax=Bradyrhizobium erythrophlei TaxID=1437360 RepID=UPI0035EC54F2
MDRREFLAATAAALASNLVCAQTRFEAASPAAAPGSLRVAARNAWLWGLPLIEMADQRAARSADGVKVNTFQHQRALITAKGQFVTTPNNDTLYSQAWLNLEKGPVTIGVPDSGSRYYCVPLMDMYSNNFAIVGTRTSGSSARTLTVVGPHEASHIPMAIRAPTNWVWILGRTLVDGESDLPKAHAFQDGWTIKGPETGAPKSYAKRSAPWDQYFASVQGLMNESPPPVTDARMLDSMTPLIQFGQPFDPSRFSADQVIEIKAGIAEAANAMAQLRRTMLARNGWSFPRFSLGNFGEDYDYRAAVALGGLAALPRVEAMYLRSAGTDGRGFDSSQSWKLTFSADQLPPVDAFWSLSMYRITADGQLFFAENPIDRYTIGDRTAGLKRGTDGSLEIWMSRTEPTSNPNANWLPAPADGKFVLILRAYMPKPSLLEGIYQVPAVQSA